jgi:hypothetical protein
MSRRKSKVKVIWRKLGKEKAWGQATIGENLIEIDRLGKDLAALLWAQNYRKVVLAPNAKPPRIT